MLKKLQVAAQYCIPQHKLSRLTGWFASIHAGMLTTMMIRAFIKRYHVNMTEALNSDPTSYKTFNAFFTRALKPGMRPISQEVDSLIHPVDGAVSQLGTINHNLIVQAKNHDYSTTALLGGDDLLAQEFSDGQFATIYLSPSDYHRIHMPVEGTLRQMIFVPGDLFSVNPLTASHVPNLFARNERVVAVFDTKIGPMAMILVGATIVASIETVWAGTISPPRGKRVTRWDYQQQGITLNKGDEMGRFKLGSTVILLFGKEAIAFQESLIPKTPTRMGEVMATKKNPQGI